MAHQARADPAGAGPREFLRGHDLHELVGGNAAIFFGKAQPQQPDLGRLGIERARKLAGLVPLAGVGLDLARHEAAHDVAERFVVRRVKRALRRCPLQHIALPGNYDAPNLPKPTCVEWLAMADHSPRPGERTQDGFATGSLNRALWIKIKQMDRQAGLYTYFR